ncbi:MAG: V-type ATPase subunit [Nitrospinota bacterium]
MIQGLYTGSINEADEYLCAVGRIRVLEGSLLRRVHLERAVEAESVTRAWNALRDASRWWAARPLTDPLGWEAHLNVRLASALQEVAFGTQGSPVASAFAIRWDFLRLKDRARRTFFGGDPEYAGVERIVSEGGFLLGGEAPLDYRKALSRLSERVSREPVVQTVDRVLDAEMFGIVFRRLDENPVPFARQYFVRRVDLLNLSVALRGKFRGSDRQEVQAWLAGGGSLSEALFLEAFGGTLSTFAAPFAGTVLEGLMDDLLRVADEKGMGHRLERLMDDHLSEFVHPGKYIAFGPEPLVGYLHGVEMEVKNVRRIMAGLARGEAEEAILGDLRRPYV